MFDECDVVQKRALGQIGGHNKKCYQIVTGQLVTRATQTSGLSQCRHILFFFPTLIRLLFMILSNFGARKNNEVSNNSFVDIMNVYIFPGRLQRGTSPTIFIV